MSKLTTLIVAASLSGAVATTTAIVASRNNNRSENVEYLKNKDNTKSEILKFSNSETGVIDVDAIRESKEVSPIVTPGRTYSGGCVSNEHPDAVVVALGASPLDAKHGTASSHSSGYNLTATTKNASVAGSVLSGDATANFVPSSGGGASGGATLAMAVASSRMASAAYSGGASGFVAISRENGKAQTQTLLAAPGDHSSYTSPPPPWVVNPSDRLPLDGAWWMLILTAALYAFVKMIRRRSVK